jgi:hypothetical protein
MQSADEEKRDVGRVPHKGFSKFVSNFIEASKG